MIFKFPLLRVRPVACIMKRTTVINCVVILSNIVQSLMTLVSYLQASCRNYDSCSFIIKATETFSKKRKSGPDLVGSLSVEKLLRPSAGSRLKRLKLRRDLDLGGSSGQQDDREDLEPRLRFSCQLNWTYYRGHGLR